MNKSRLVLAAMGAIVIILIVFLAFIVMGYDKRNIFRHVYIPTYTKARAPATAPATAPVLNWAGYEKEQSINRRCGPYFDNLSCTGSQCCSYWGWCGGKTGDKDEWCWGKNYKSGEYDAIKPSYRDNPDAEKPPSKDENAREPTNDEMQKYREQKKKK